MGYYSFGPYNDRFIGIMTVVPVNNPEQTIASQIRICMCETHKFEYRKCETFRVKKRFVVSC